MAMAATAMASTATAAIPRKGKVGIMEQQTHQSQAPAPMDLTRAAGKMLRSLAKLWFIPLILAVIGGGLQFYSAATSFVPQYRTEAVLRVAVGDSEGYSSYYDNTAAQNAAAVFPYLLSSDVMQEQLRAQLGGAVRGNITSSRMSDSSLMTIAVTGTDPQAIYNTLEAVLVVYPQVSQRVSGDIQLVVVREPSVPTQPYNTLSWKRATATGAVTWGGVGLVLVLVLGLLGTTATSSRDVKEQVNLPCLAKVPKVALKQRKNSLTTGLLITKENMDPGFREAFRQLRHRLLRDMNANEEKVLLFTSSVPSEGKTSVAANTALAIAQTGKRVLLVDGDLRNPSIKTALGLTQDSVGLGQCLLNASQEVTFRRFEDTSLFLFAGDQPIANPSRLLHHDRLRRIFDSLRPMFDYIVVDTPPCCMMADASALCRHGDRLVYVIREDYATRSQIRDGVSSLCNTGIHPCGFVFNQATDTKSSHYGYGYGYGYEK